MPRENYTTEEWLGKVFEKFPENAEKYDYSKAVYTGTREKLTIICKKHGEFKQRAYAHLMGQGCPKCKGGRISKAKTFITKEIAIERFVAKHGDTYDYSLVDFKSPTEKVTIICKEHGPFQQTPHHHWNGNGCPLCGYVKTGEGVKKQEVDVVERFLAVHGDRYDYSQFVYEGMLAKSSIKCNKCGRFFDQRPADHIKGYGCPSCPSTVSKVERSVFDFVKSICPDAEQSNRTVLDDGKELDIFVPSKRVAIEVNGIFWHGDNHKPTNYHYKKWQACKEKGIRLIQITDYDWENNRKVFSQLLAHALGCNSKRKVNARDCKVVHLKSRECKEFYDAYHPQGHSPNPINLALITKEGEIVAIMSFGYGKTTRGQARANGTTKATWELSRFASNCSVRGGASKLFKTFIRENNPEEVISFSMNDYFAGGVYEVLGFVAETYGKPDYRVFHPGNGLRPKPHWQRRLIPKRLEEIGRSDVNFNPDRSIDPRTEREIEDLVGAIRLWDSAKIKWVWKAE